MRGTEFDTSGILDYAEINNSVTINGNGVVLTNGPLPLNAYPSDYKTIRITDFVFKNLQESAFYYAPYKGGSLTIDRCILMVSLEMVTALVVLSVVHQLVRI